MKTVFSTFLVLNFLAEGMAAAMLIGGPEGVAAAGSGGMWSMHYGFAALAMASASLWVWRVRTDLAAVTAVLGVLLTFHIGILISLSLAGDQMAGVVIHAVLATLCLLAFTQRSKWCIGDATS